MFQLPVIHIVILKVQELTQVLMVVLYVLLLIIKLLLLIRQSIMGSGFDQYAYISAYSAPTNTLSLIYLKTVPLNFKRFFTFPVGVLGANPIGIFNSVNKCYYFMSTTIPQFWRYSCFCY